MNNNIKFIYFDIGNVMADTDDYFKGVTSKFNIPLSEFTEFWNGGNGADEMTRGKITAKDFWRTAVTRFNMGDAFDFDFLESWLNDYKPILGTHKLAQKLMERYRVGLISNLYPGMIDKLIERGLVADLNYSAVVLSCETGFRKPEKEIYEIATKKAGTLPEEIFFIDDRSDFLEGARSYGWNTFRFNYKKIDDTIAGIEKILL